MPKTVTIISVLIISALLAPASTWACGYGYDCYAYEYQPIGYSTYVAEPGYTGSPGPGGYGAYFASPGYSGSPASSGFGASGGYGAPIGYPASIGYRSEERRVGKE